METRLAAGRGTCSSRASGTPRPWRALEEKAEGNPFMAARYARYIPQLHV